MSDKPKTDVVVKLIGEDGHVFFIIGNVSRELKRAGYSDLAKEFSSAAMVSNSYSDVLNLVQDYVTIE